VQTILNIHKHYDDLLDRAFGKDTRFIRAMDVAHQFFINQNAVTDAARSSNKTSELLTRYVDSLLRKGGKNVEEQELDMLLSNVVGRFRCGQMVNRVSSLHFTLDHHLQVRE
jgi:cullin 1